MRDTVYSFIAAASDPRQCVRDCLFLADFRWFSRIRSKISENLQEKYMMAPIFARMRENQPERKSRPPWQTVTGPHWPLKHRPDLRVNIYRDGAPPLSCASAVRHCLLYLTGLIIMVSIVPWRHHCDVNIRTGAIYLKANCVACAVNIISQCIIRARTNCKQ